MREKALALFVIGVRLARHLLRDAAEAGDCASRMIVACGARDSESNNKCANLEMRVNFTSKLPS